MKSSCKYWCGYNIGRGRCLLYHMWQYGPWYLMLRATSTQAPVFYYILYMCGYVGACLYLVFDQHKLDISSYVVYLCAFVLLSALCIHLIGAYESNEKEEVLFARAESHCKETLSP